MTNSGELKEWKCKHGHILGVVRRQPVSNNGRTYYVTQLMSYRHAVDMASDHSVDVDLIIGPIEGSAGPFQCDVPGCGCKRPWIMGEAAMGEIPGYVGG